MTVERRLRVVAAWLLAALAPAALVAAAAEASGGAPAAPADGARHGRGAPTTEVAGPAVRAATASPTASVTGARLRLTVAAPPTGAPVPVGRPVTVEVAVAPDAGAASDVWVTAGAERIFCEPAGPTVWGCAWPPWQAGDTVTLVAHAWDRRYRDSASAPLSVRVVAADPGVVLAASPAVTASETVILDATPVPNPLTAAAVTTVDYYVGEHWVGSADRRSDWAVEWDTTWPGQGRYAITAVAHDELGSSGTSAPREITVLR